MVPAHGRPAPIAACLRALAAQTLPHAQFEVLVCDDGSQPPLEEQLQTTLGSMPGTLRVTLFRQPRGGPARARNTAAMHAQGRYLAFTDDDCLPTPGWLASLAECFAESPDHLIGGGLVNALSDNVFSTASQLIMDAVYEYQVREGRGRFLFASANLAMPAQAFRQSGGFSGDFRFAAGEDYDFAARWRHQHRPARFAREAAVRHVHPLTLQSFLRQHFTYGRGLYRMRQKLARRNGHSMRPSSAGLYAALIRHPLTRGLGARGWMLACLVVIAQTATIAGALTEVVLIGGPAQPDPCPIGE